MLSLRLVREVYCEVWKSGPPITIMITRAATIMQAVAPSTLVFSFLDSLRLRGARHLPEFISNLSTGRLFPWDGITVCTFDGVNICIRAVVETVFMENSLTKGWRGGECLDCLSVEEKGLSRLAQRTRGLPDRRLDS